jgi:hypothetical protein
MNITEFENRLSKVEGIMQRVQRSNKIDYQELADSRFEEIVELKQEIKRLKGDKDVMEG